MKNINQLFLCSSLILITCIVYAESSFNQTDAKMPNAAQEKTQIAQQPGFNPGNASPNLRSVITPRYLNLAYASKSKNQVLDIFVPNGTGPFPVIFIVHGGAFRFGTKDQLNKDLGQALLKNGFAIVAVEYRLSGEALFPAAVQDVKAAVRYIRANAKKYNLDPVRFGAYGESAGGNLVALLGTTGNQSTLFDDVTLGNAGISSSVQAVASLYGPIDFSQIDRMLRTQKCNPSAINHDTKDGFESLYLGAPLPQVPEKVKQANPTTYVDTQDPPFLIQNGGKDCNVGAEQGKLLAESLSEKKVPYRIDFFENSGHGGASFESPSNIKKIVNFFKAYLK